MVFQKKEGVNITNYKWRICPQCELYTLTNKLTQLNATTIQMKKKNKRKTELDGQQQLVIEVAGLVLR